MRNIVTTLHVIIITGLGVEGASIIYGRAQSTSPACVLFNGILYYSNLEPKPWTKTLTEHVAITGLNEEVPMLPTTTTRMTQRQASRRPPISLE